MQDYTHYPLPRTAHSEQYDNSLSVVKQQIDLVFQQGSHSAMAWLDEVQRHINRARDQILSELPQ